MAAQNVIRTDKNGNEKRFISVTSVAKTFFGGRSQNIYRAIKSKSTAYGYYWRYAKPTNSEMLRSLNDIQLSQKLRGCPDSVEHCPKIDCAACWLSWLQKEIDNG